MSGGESKWVSFARTTALGPADKAQFVRPPRRLRNRPSRNVAHQLIIYSNLKKRVGLLLSQNTKSISQKKIKINPVGNWPNYLFTRTFSQEEAITNMAHQLVFYLNLKKKKLIFYSHKIPNAFLNFF